MSGSLPECPGCDQYRQLTPAAFASNVLCLGEPPLTGSPRQSFTAFIDHVPGRCGRVSALGLLVVLVALVPLAGASPPDPLWISGIYDAADSDDVVQAVTSLESVAREILLDVSPVSIVARAPLTPGPTSPDGTRRSTRARAPPTS